MKTTKLRSISSDSEADISSKSPPNSKSSSESSLATFLSGKKKQQQKVLGTLFLHQGKAESLLFFGGGVGSPENKRFFCCCQKTKEVNYGSHQNHHYPLFLPAFESSQFSSFFYPNEFVTLKETIFFSHMFLYAYFS